MSEEDPGAPAEDPAPVVNLRDAAVAPPRQTIVEILERLPAAPGVYIMKDRRGKVVYIGKAAVLRNRVRQYFQASSGDNRDFVPLLDGIVADIETVITSNEKEALLLENTLIKKHQPRFNVNLRDDKNYLVLRLDPEAEWPRLEVVRKLAGDGAFYFGPYHSASACREALRIVNRHFQLRTCTDHVLHNRRRPCLQYQIKRCPAPCVLPVSKDEYADQVRDVRLFLEGKSDELLSRLGTRMKEAAARTDFVDQDVFGFYRQGIALEIVVLSIRQGKMLGSRGFSFTGQEFPDAELLSSFIGLYYDLSVTPPDEVLLPFAIEDADLKADWLADKRTGRRRKVEILVPQRGDRRKLVELAQKNAAASFTSRRNARQDTEVALGKLQRRLKLARLPRVIECYDISHIQGFATVASMVVFVDGRPEKSRYRTYKVRTGDRPDDFASMYEVLSRRFRRAREAQADGDVESAEANREAGSWALPDLIVIDGGKGQLGMALAAARDVGIDIRPGVGLPIIGLAKERDLVGEAIAAEEGTDTPANADARAGASAQASVAVATGAAETAEPAPADAEDDADAAGKQGASAGNGAPTKDKDKAKPDKTRAPDRVFLPHAKDAIPIRPNTAEMFVLQHLRDEAHRFAITFHRQQRKRLTLRSALSAIPGIGIGRQRLLLRHFGSLKKIRESSLEDLVAVPGMTRKSAEAVYAHWKKQPLPAYDGVAARADAQEQGAGASAGSAPAEVDEDALESAFADIEADADPDEPDPLD